MSVERQLKVMEVLLASAVASSATYILTYAMMCRYVLWITGLDWGNAIPTAFRFFPALLVWLFAILVLRFMPQWFFLRYRRRGALVAQDFEPWRRKLEHTGWTIGTGVLLIPMFLLLIGPVLSGKPLFLALPLGILVGWRRLLALPEPTDARNRLTTIGPLTEGLNEETSSVLYEAEVEEERARRDWENR
jgi:hypothetical protein